MLTCRVAHLVRCHAIKPTEVTAVTFTNKAANEMRKRLTALLGEKQAGELVLGELSWSVKANGQVHSTPHVPGSCDDMASG